MFMAKIFRIRTLGSFCLMFIVLFTHSALAAVPPDYTDKEIQKQRAQQQAEEQRRQAQQKDIFLQQGKKADADTSLPAEKVSFVIHTIQLEGQHKEAFPWTDKMLRKYLGRRIGMEGINLIVKRLTNAFIDRGYVTTRVVIPEQDLSQGTLRLTLVPGVISAIRFQDPDFTGNWQTAFPARPGDILNLRKLEQGLEQMKRVPSQDVNMQLVPGKNPGESDVVISVVKSKPWKVVLSLDDSGTKSTGKLQASQTFSLDNLLGINDLFNISLNSDADKAGNTRGTRGDSLYYSFPYGESTVTFSKSSYRYHQTIDSSPQTFQFSGRSSNTEFRLSQLLQRDQTSKNFLDFSIITSNSNSFIDDTEILTQRKNNTAAQLGISHRRYYGQNTLDLSVACKKGVPWFGAQADPVEQTTGAATTRYTLWTCDVNLSTPMTIGQAKGRYTAGIRGQYTQNRLLGSEYFSIGNRYTVRGFDGEETLAADKGWYWRNEISLPVEKGGYEVYWGLDYGQVGGFGSAGLPGRTLAGTVLGIRGGTPQTQYDFFVGSPLHKPAGFKTAHVTFGLQLIQQF